jgi:hypothetical protein
MQLTAKYLVLKTEDIDAALDSRGQFYLSQIVQSVRDYREKQGKTDNRYFVINDDEPYFDEVVRLVVTSDQEKRNER